MNIITNDTELLTHAETGLRNVIDPEIGLNVVDLGLIYQVDFDPDFKRVYCTMTLTTRFCPMGESIQAGVANALQQCFPEYEISLELIYDPPWNAGRISDKGKEFLNQ